MGINEETHIDNPPRYTNVVFPFHYISMFLGQCYNRGHQRNTIKKFTTTE